MPDETVILRKVPTSFAYLFMLNGVRRGDHLALKASGSTIGRSPESDLILDDPAVSLEHARIRQEGTVWYVYDLASENQVFVADEAVGRKALADGDRLRIGETDLVFRLVS